ncbi:hypothetical protein K9M79_02720 [Candidatus Woesearchaeota archaeon]|nr:hypothetical protein [Candidatus Woesearchaeota archaeon]
MDKRIVYAICIIIAIVTVVSIPFLEKSIFPDSEGPGAVTVLGVGIIFTAITVLLFYLFYKDKNLTKGFFISAITYSSLIILVKFTLGPLSLYKVNQAMSFDPISLTPLGILLISTFTLLLYIGVFYFLFFIFNKSLKNEKTKKKHNIFKIIAFILLIGLIAAVSALPILLLSTSFGIIYLFYAFSSSIGVIMALGLLIAVLFCTLTYNEVKKREIAMKDAGLLVSFFWIGAAILFSYSALWFIYFMTLMALWPLRTFTFSVK